MLRGVVGWEMCMRDGMVMVLMRGLEMGLAVVVMAGYDGDGDGEVGDGEGDGSGGDDGRRW